MNLSRITLIAAVTVFLCLEGASADVKLKQKTKNSGFAGIGASESEEVTLVTADKMKTTSSTRFTGGVVGFFAGKGPRTQTHIVRLDKELTWETDDKEKSYKEITFARMRAQMEEARAKMKDTEKPDAEEQSDTKINLRWDVRKTGESKTINGFPCDHVIVTLVVEEENLKTHEKRELSYFTLDQWLTTGQEKAQAEIEAFHLKMAKAMGLAELGADFMSALLAQYGDYLKQLREKGKELKGLPILSIVSIETVGSPKEEEKEVKEEKPKIELPGGLGGLFGKKKSKEKEEEKKEAKSTETQKVEPGKPGRSTLFSVTTEVLEVSTTSVSPSEFQVPAGYEKED